MKTTKGSPSHILVVDDDEIIRGVAYEAFTGAGFCVTLAQNGYMATQVLENHHADLILLDVMMPVMNGFDTTLAIRKMKGYKNVPILIMTALDDLDSINQAFQAGATDFMMKPLNWGILVERVRFMIRTFQLMKTQQKLQIKLVQAQKMEALGTFAGTVAHDLNNQLSGIVSYPDVLLSQLDADSPLRKPILTMQNAGQKAAAIVNDLLALVRRGVKVTQVVNMNDIVLEYLSSPEYARLISFHPDILVETDLDPTLLNVTGSPIHIYKSIMNLVSNAAEAQPDGGRIKISTYRRTFNGSQIDNVAGMKGPYSVFEITDQGHGISAEDKDRIFEPFYTKKVMGRSGTGLGMAVVWGTVQDHHGYIDIKSKLNEGTTFTIYFPSTSESIEKKPDPVAVDDYKGSGQVILIVDDVREQREMAVQLLEVLNYHPVAVSSGEEALDYLCAHCADLVLLDMIMPPGIDGLETYQRILAAKPKQKALVTSGYTETERVKQALQLGAGVYIRKPYTLETIGLAIKKELNKSA
jgi:CheY-like chemotaxis protein